MDPLTQPRLPHGHSQLAFAGLADDHGRPGEFRRELSDNSEIAPVRGALLDWLALQDGMGTAATYQNVELASSELLTNAIEHRCGDAVRVETHLTDAGTVALTVTNAVDQGNIADPSTWTMPSADAVRGRGLAIVKAVADDVDVELHHAHVVITATFARP